MATKILVGWQYWQFENAMVSGFGNEAF